MHWRVGRTERGVNVLQCGDSDDHLQLFFLKEERGRGGALNAIMFLERLKHPQPFLNKQYEHFCLLIIFLDDTWEEISPGKSRNTMKMEHLSRAELNTELECQVAN